ncbi:MAG: hypothetical protein HY565_03345 [Candidatus Kerfeldbacteria bacterium]|nr:hypothetical protein [Candidatus Kerfeldbacteria bacterium]
MPNCLHCQQAFTITDSDRQFYGKIAVPEPTHCPICRLRRRLVFRNESHLYERTCDLCKKNIIAVFKPGTPFPVYCSDCWWSDRWDPLSYGRNIDWNRPFFAQFQELMHKVPKAAVISLNNENSDYNALLAFSKNMYMCPGSYLSENCYYVRKSQNCKDCANSMILNKCELVANSTNCDTCYASHHLTNCRSCSFSTYLQNCSGIQYGFMCCGVKNLKYCFKNKVYSETEYHEILKRYQGKAETELLAEFRQFCVTIPKAAQIQVNCDGSTGDYLFNCHNAVECFDCFDLDTSKYLLECAGVKDSMDLSMHDKEIELCYELSSGGEKNYLTKFSYCTCASPESEYCYSCFYLSNGFGCDGIHARSQYCILNKQYSKEEYEKLHSRLIEHMRTTKEYGEFFPEWLSPFSYEESVAPDYLAAVTQSVCTKPFRVIEQEKVLYKKIGVPEPTVCMDCRFQRLRSWKNPRQLWQRNCARCSKAIETTYAPDRPETVLCDDCYKQVMY